MRTIGSSTVHDTAVNNAAGIVWALITTALFAMVAAMAKVAVVEYHVLQILFFRQIVVLSSALPSIAGTLPDSLKTRYPGWHTLRLGGAFTALSCSIWAVSLLPLTTATALGFAHVFFVALLAYYFLGESVDLHRLLAVAIGFTGVTIIIRPGTDSFISLYSLIPLIGALGAALAKISVRRLTATESTATLLAYQAVFVGVLAGVPLFWFWKTPNLKDLIFLLLMGVVATVAQWTGVRALRLGEASVVGHVDYCSLLFAALLGYFVFSETPDRYTVIGALLIVAASAYVYQRESRIKKTPVTRTA